MVLVHHGLAELLLRGLEQYYSIPSKAGPSPQLERVHRQLHLHKSFRTKRQGVSGSSVVVTQ